MRPRLSLVATPLLVAAALLTMLGRTWWTNREPDEFEFRDGRRDHVVRVEDGATLELEDGVRVRLIGVEPPTEDEAEARAATAFLREAVGDRTVELTFDRERIDRDDRILAFVHDEVGCVNESIIAAGHARALRGVPFSSTRQRSFRKAEESARSAKRGLWAAE